MVAIISLLVSILLPSLTGAKELARTAVCFSNLRALSTAGRMYHEDNNQRLFGGSWANKESYHNKYYPDVHSPGIIKYLGYDDDASLDSLRGKYTVATCPSSYPKWPTPSQRLWRTYGMNGWLALANYLIEYGLDAGSHPDNPNPTLSFDTVVRTAEMGYFFDSATNRLEPSGNWNDYYYWEAPTNGQVYYNWWRHSPHVGENNQNVIFVDGHAEGIPEEDMLIHGLENKYTSTFWLGAFK